MPLLFATSAVPGASSSAWTANDSITVGAVENATGAINVGANAVAQPVNIGTGAAARVITIGNAASASLALEGGVGAFTVDCDGVLELNSSAGVISIGNDAVSQTINVGTGAAARQIGIGNATGATTVVVNVGTGNADFGANATAHTTRIGSTTGTSSTIIQAGTGAIRVPDGSRCDYEGAGTGTGEVVSRCGCATGIAEGFERRVYAETVLPNAISTNLLNLPAMGIVQCVLTNVQTALTGGGTTTNYAVGTAGDPNMFSQTAGALAQNSKTTQSGDATYAIAGIAAGVQITLNGVTGAGAIGDTALTVGSVRVVIVYDVPVALANA